MSYKTAFSLALRAHAGHMRAHLKNLRQRFKYLFLLLKTPIAGVAGAIFLLYLFFFIVPTLTTI